MLIFRLIQFNSSSATVLPALQNGEDAKDPHLLHHDLQMVIILKVRERIPRRKCEQFFTLVPMQFNLCTLRQEHVSFWLAAGLQLPGVWVTIHTTSGWIKTAVEVQPLFLCVCNPST